ncbi:MAG: hypothetical protein JXO22_15985 [Phycisphaerae bacterium]|nr:hypothetical protein [Phycisphaerae bacterium]
MTAVLLALTLADPMATDRWGHEPYADSSPLDVAVSPVDGKIYVAKTADGLVVELAPDFKPTGYTLEAPGVAGLDVAADGTLVVVTAGVLPGSGVPDGASQDDGNMPTRSGSDEADQGGENTPARSHSGSDTTPSVIVVPPDRGQPVRFGQAGDGPGQFDRPCGVSFGPNNTIFVFDTFNSRVQVFDRQGQFILEFGQYTWTRRYYSTKEKRHIQQEVEDRLHRPVRGDFLPDGRLIIADYDGPTIDPELDRRGGMFSVWHVDVAARTATFEKFAQPDSPFADSRAGDVCVDQKTGRIYYLESDFPLTDHDFVRVANNVDEAPTFGLKGIPYCCLTHPRGVALTANGDVVVADADKGVVVAWPARLFDTPKDHWSPLEWPKAIRIPVSARDRVAIEYTTLDPTLTRARFAPLGEWYDYPQPPPEDGRQAVEAPALNDRWEPLSDGQSGTRHRVEFKGLTPGTRYAWQFLVTDRAYPGPLWSETQIVTTQPPASKAQYLDAEVVILLFTDLVTMPDDPNVKPEPADPGPMTPEQIEAVKQRLEMSRRFYWINSRCDFNLRFTYVIEPQRYDPGPVPSWGYWPHEDHRQIDEILAKHGVNHADIAGLCVIYGYRHWDTQKDKWVLSGSGGNTWGSCHDGSGINTINAGGDTAWLFTHEYGHSMGINYEYSGQIYHFNHFHWNFLPTDYGAHYDGSAAITRQFDDVCFWANKYGRLVVVDDADADGLPDDDHRVPVDEARFGSDAAKADSDEDGLADLEELMATQGLASYAGAFGMRQVAPVFEPDPTNIDTDGDGLRDGDDRYPLYPWTPVVRQARVTVDGNMAPDEWPSESFRRLMQDKDITGDFRMAWDEHYLYLGMTQKIVAEQPRPINFYVEFDFNNDGMTVGADNQEMNFEPQPDGRVRVHTRFNDTAIRLQPTWTDNILPSPVDVLARWSVREDEFQVEIAIPRTRDAGLDLVRFEQLGFMIELYGGGLAQRLRLFEPQSHFDVTLR